MAGRCAVSLALRLFREAFRGVRMRVKNKPCSYYLPFALLPSAKADSGCAAPEDAERTRSSRFFASSSSMNAQIPCVLTVAPLEAILELLGTRNAEQIEHKMAQCFLFYCVTFKGTTDLGSR